MDYSELYENKKRGSFDFPIELYYVDKSSPRYQMPLHWHLEYELITVLSGSFKLSLDGKTFILNSGDCAWIGDGVVHGGIPDDCIYECIVFDLTSFLHNMPVCSKNATLFLSNSSAYTGIYRKGSRVALLCDEIFDSMECEKNGYEFTTIGLMWELLGEFVSTSSFAAVLPYDKFRVATLKDVLTYIRNNIDKHITLDELAKTAGMSPKYFCRVFKEITGKTPIEYLNYFRIEYACEMLTFTDESVTEIALSCGFGDMSYFSKSFARYKGMSPTKFRHTVRS